MVNLVSAKCPNCGSLLKLDDNMKRAECEYCKATIIVDDAIEKYKLEISGNVKIDGFQSESDKLEILKKHIKLEKYDEANKLISEILKNNPYNLEVLKMKVIISTSINDALETLDVMEKLDEKKEYDGFINENRNYLNTMKEEITKDNKKYAIFLPLYIVLVIILGIALLIINQFE